MCIRDRLLPDIMGKDQIIISPDDFLFNIPFAALSTSSESLEYIVETKDLAYAYSVSTFARNCIADRQVLSLVGINPYSIEFKHDYIVNEQLEKAPIRSNFLESSKATLNNTITAISVADIVHISTHSRAKDSIYSVPSFSLFDTIVEVTDVLSYSSKSKLVVLNSCESGIGSIVSGDISQGLMQSFSTIGTVSYTHLTLPTIYSV